VGTNDTTLAALSFGLADLLATDLSRSSRLTVVERLRLDAVLRELQLAGSGMVDSGTAPRVGRVVGARRLVLGAIDQLPNGNVALNAQIGDVVSGGVVTAVSAQAPLTRIFDAEAALALQITGALGITLTPAERAAIESHPTQSVAALVAYSRGVRDEAYGRYGAAAQQYQAALQSDPGFANARSRLSGLGGLTIAGGGNAAATRRGAGSTASGNRAAQIAAASVNPSLADIATGGATAAVAVSQTASGTSAVQRSLFATVVIILQPVP
jgi:TolB-like protein